MQKQLELTTFLVITGIVSWHSSSDDRGTVLISILSRTTEHWSLFILQPIVSLSFVRETLLTTQSARAQKKIDFIA